MRNTIITSSLAILMLAGVGDANAQAVSIKITDKFDSPRGDLELYVEVHGVNFRGELVRISGGPATTNSDGRISFIIPTNKLEDFANVLQQSKEVRVSLEPETPNLNAVVIAGLLGTADQSMAIVMKERGVPVKKDIEVPCPPVPHRPGCGRYIPHAPSCYWDHWMCHRKH
jgi:hypothetical protein